MGSIIPRIKNGLTICLNMYFGSNGVFVIQSKMFQFVYMALVMKIGCSVIPSKLRRDMDFLGRIGSRK